jgi:Cdc6-like AAA superfamily ATPase
MTGKTILSTYMIKRMQEEQGFTTAYHICNSYTTGKNLLAEILRSITVQFLRSNLELAPFIFENYANKGLAPSIVRLRKLLPELVATLTSIRVIVDGLDEYPVSDQRIILTELLTLSKSSGGQCKILFSNREGQQINKLLKDRATISLKDQSVDVNKDIEAYVHAKLEDFRGPFDDRLIDRIEHQVVSKADGK